jgi:signal transduction histidine kinase/CheY-like chemotaxis protein
LVWFVFAAAATIGGFFVTDTLQDKEVEQALTRFHFMADSGLKVLYQNSNSVVYGFVEMAKNVAYARSNSSQWPEVLYPGFYDVTPAVKQTTRASNIEFLPIVQPDKLSSFEAFMYNYFATEPKIPPGAGVQNFGRGVYAINQNDPNLTYHDTTGVPILYNSTNHILTPILQLTFSAEITYKRLAYNAHSDPTFGQAMDYIINVCSPVHNYSMASNGCGYVSKAVPLPLPTQSDPEPEVTDFRSVFIQPIYLHQNSSELVGFIFGAMLWQDILDAGFPMHTELVCVVAGQVIFTYAVTEDGAKFMGPGDQHSPKFDEEIRKVELFSGLLSGNHSSFTVYLYPSQALVEQFTTNTPLYAGIAMGLAIALLGTCFALYDTMKARASRKQGLLLTAKRQFVRFISHEIRTPLNSLHLGLELLTEELKMCAAQLAAATGPTVELFNLLRKMVPNWQELCVDLVSNSECAVDVLNDLLNYDKIEMGTLRLDFACVPIFALVEKNVKAFLIQAQQKSTKLSLTGECWDGAAAVSEQAADEYRSLVVLGDHSRLSQILRNLLSNALKFAPVEGEIAVCAEWVQGGLPNAPVPTLPTDQQVTQRICVELNNIVTLDACVSLRCPQDQADLLHLSRAGCISVTVTDNGVGLSGDQLGHLFGEGVQFNPNELQAGQGSGLGLYISRGLAVQHGGTLTAASAGLGQGCTFTLQLPMHRRPLPTTAELALRSQGPTHTASRLRGDLMVGFQGFRSPPMRSETKSPTSESTNRRHSDSHRVLVVDDAVSNRKMLVRLLKSRGYACEQAENGQQAVDMYRDFCERNVQVETVVMDYEMPVMNGPTATRALRELGCDALIVGVTGNLLPEDVRFFKEHGADAVLGKPLDIRAFEELVVDLRDGTEHMPSWDRTARGCAGNRVDESNTGLSAVATPKPTFCCVEEHKSEPWNGTEEKSALDNV